MRWFATPSPGRTTPAGAAACSSARTTVVPTATIRPPSDSRAADRGRRGIRNAIRLVERKPPIELRVAGRRDARRKRDRGERDAALAHRADRSPSRARSRRTAARRRPARRRSASTRPTARAAPARARTGSAGRAARGRPTPPAANRRSAATPAADDRAAPRWSPTAARAQTIARRQHRRQRPVLGPRAKSPGAEDDGGSGPILGCVVWKSPGAEDARLANAWTSSARPSEARDRRAALRSRRRSARARRAGWRAASPHRWRSPDRPAAENRRTAIAARAMMRPSASTTSSLASRGRWTGRCAAIMTRLRDAARPASATAAGRQGRRNRVRELARGRLGPLERRRVGIGHGQRVQRRVHVARIERQERERLRPRAPRPRCGSCERSAALLAPYAPHCGYALTAASLDTLSTTLPRPSRADAASAPSSALVSRNGPSTLVASASSRSSHSVSASSASGTGPRLDALLTSTSSPPRLPAICSAIGWMSSFRATSPTMP